MISTNLPHHAFVYILLSKVLICSCKFCTYTLLTLLTKNLLLCYVLQPVSVVTTYVSPSSVIPSSSSTGGYTLTLTSSTDDESTTSSLTTVDITGMQPHGFNQPKLPPLPLSLLP